MGGGTRGWALRGSTQPEEPKVPVTPPLSLNKAGSDQNPLPPPHLPGSALPRQVFRTSSLSASFFLLSFAVSIPVAHKETAFVTDAVLNDFRHEICGARAHVVSHAVPGTYLSLNVPFVLRTTPWTAPHLLQLTAEEAEAQGGCIGNTSHALTPTVQAYLP